MPPTGEELGIKVRKAAVTGSNAPTERQLSLTWIFMAKRPNLKYYKNPPPRSRNLFKDLTVLVQLGLGNVLRG
ncbi:MAG: hypothetical protein SW833_05400 [Cyanobacteriota bacterium]|nr:hypothetical protein [Cyanobacteriota bacterium]